MDGAEPARARVLPRSPRRLDGAARVPAFFGGAESGHDGPPRRPPMSLFRPLVHCSGFALSALGLLLAGCAGLVEPSAGSAPQRSANISGTLTTGPMRSMPPLAQRGVGKLALVVDMKPDVSFASVGLTVFNNRGFSVGTGPAALPAAEVAAMFARHFAEHSDIALVDVSAAKESLMPHLEVSVWDGSAAFAKGTAATAKLAELKAQGIDAVLVVHEIPLPDFMGGSGVRLEPKGLYRRSGIFCVYGGFQVRLMDTATGKEMRHAAYVQAVSDPIYTLAWHARLEEFSEGEMRALGAAMRKLYAVNVAETARALKADRQP